jgi:hypothetical protein
MPHQDLVKLNGFARRGVKVKIVAAPHQLRNLSTSFDRFLNGK